MVERLLKKKNMTKYRLAVEAGIPHATLNDICSGKTRLEKCSAETVYKLAKVLGVSMEMLTVAGIQNTERERAYEFGLPEYLQHDLDAYKEGLKNKSDLLDCLWGELYGSINIAEINDGAITQEHAEFLRNKYLFGGKHDRHNGNWGFLYDDSTKEASLAPIYDCGSCLLPQAGERIMEQALVNEDMMNARIFQFPTSAIKLDGRKINYYDFLMSAEEAECNAAIQRMVPKFNLEQIKGFIDEVPYITKLQKTFYKRYITVRFEQILKPAYDMVM